jgi:hypothetical protein
MLILVKLMRPSLSLPDLAHRLIRNEDANQSASLTCHNAAEDGRLGDNHESVQST